MIKKLSGNALIKDTDGDITAIDKSFKIDEKPTNASLSNASPIQSTKSTSSKQKNRAIFILTSNI